MSLLEVRGLRVAYGRAAPVVDGLDLDLAPGEALALAGGSGSGKTQLVLGMFGLLPPGAAVGGRVRFQGEEILGLPQRKLDRIRGTQAGFIFQDPGSALNPYLRIGTQLGELLRLHAGLRGRAARQRGIKLLRQVRIPDPRACLAAYPHQLSGGMRQRILLAMALIPGPRLLVADEPTTALDVTVQAEMLQLLHRHCREAGMALLLITHDLAVAATLCSRIAVLQSGRVVEEGPLETLRQRARHPATRELLQAAVQEQS